MVLTVWFLSQKVQLNNALKPQRGPSPLKMINYRVFLVPVIIMIIGCLIWGFVAVFWPTNLPLMVLGQIIVTIGMFVAIILGLWVMTIVRMPVR